MFIVLYFFYEGGGGTTNQFRFGHPNGPPVYNLFIYLIRFIWNVIYFNVQMAMLHCVY